MFVIKSFKAKLLALCLVLVFAVPTIALSDPILPQWFRNPYRMFNRNTYLAARGSGNSPHTAGRNALRQLVTEFGLSIYVAERLTVLYQTGSGAETVINNVVEITAGMNNLVGARIGYVQGDGRGNYFALAVLNRAEAISFYSARIRMNLEMIDNLVRMTAEERYTFNGYSSYRLAAVIADVNTGYAELLSVAGEPRYIRELRRGDDFLREAMEIRRAIPIGININNDRAGIIRGAFASSFSELGFVTGGTNSRFLLDVNIIAQPTDHPASQVVFTRIEVTANLVDTNTGTVLLPYNFNERVGHMTQPEADNRAFLAAEQRITSEYGNILLDHLSRLIPQR